MKVLGFRVQDFKFWIEGLGVREKQGGRETEREREISG